MHLNSLGYSSFSLTGSQAGIITTSRHGQAEIEDIDVLNNVCDQITNYHFEIIVLCYISLITPIYFVYTL